MKTAGELRGEAQHLRELAIAVDDVEVRAAVATLVAELERRARELENGHDE